MARDIYVDGKLGSAAGTGSFYSPLATIWAAGVMAKPCDTIHVAPTIVYPRQGIQYLHGTAVCPIRFIGKSPTTGALTQLHSSDANEPALMMYGVSYIEVSGFNLTGEAKSGCFRASSPNAANITHHVTLTGNVISNCAVNGILFFQSDYVTISHNTIHNTSRYTLGGRYGSGITILGSWNLDGSTAPKTIIDSNMIWDARNTRACGPNDSKCLSTALVSDGSGIILDANCITYRYATGAAPNRFQPCYVGRTVISNNIVMGNGGRGIYVYRSSHVTVVNNTAYGNNIDPYEGQYQPGELEVNNGGDVLFYNNLSISLGGLTRNGKGYARHCITVQGLTGTDRQYVGGPGYINPNQPGAGAGPVIGRNNWCYIMNNIGAPPNFISYYVAGSSLQDAGYGNPRLARLALDATGDFRPLPDSPVLNRTNLSLYNLARDLQTVSRQPQSALGAYAGPFD